MYTVRFEFDGIIRNYPCESYFDAITLRHALEVTYGATTTSLWQGATKI